METNRFLKGLTPAEFAQLEPLFKTRTFRAGERLLTEGAINSELFLLDAGTVRLGRRRQAHAGEVLGAGKFFGLVSLLDGHPSQHDAVAASDGSVRIITQHDLLEILSVDTPLAAKLLRNLVGTLVDRVREIDERFANYAGQVTSLRRYN